MYSKEQKEKAIALYEEYKELAIVIKILGYPTSSVLWTWVKDYKENNNEVVKKNSKWANISLEKQLEAVDYFLANGMKFTKTIRHFGYPSVYILTRWLAEHAPGWNQIKEEYGKQDKSVVSFSSRDKVDAVLAMSTKSKTMPEIYKEYSLDPAKFYYWKSEVLGNKGIFHMTKDTMLKEFKEMQKKLAELQKECDSLSEAHTRLTQKYNSLNKDLYQKSLEHDILVATNEILKKGKSINIKSLKNYEKAIVIDALRHKYKLADLLEALEMAKSSYSYQVKIREKSDKYADLRKHMIKIFKENYEQYGYRRIKLQLKNEGVIVSEKLVRKLMKDEKLFVRHKKNKKYCSYKGELTPAPENLVKRNFHSDKPNKIWLTDITEFKLPSGKKVYLSPIIDCFDGYPVSWTIGTSPNANLVNTMLKQAINSLGNSEAPIIHSDRGAHYRWPEWILLMKQNGLKRSMSKKGCSPDNAACEGFFGRAKNEMFYNRNWKNTDVNSFIQWLDNYMHWYREKRIKKSLGGLSPLNYRKKLKLVI